MDGLTPGGGREAGRAQRAELPRSAQGDWHPHAGRDALAAVADDEGDRIPELLPLRRARMAASPLAFLRGTASLAAADLASIPSTGLRVQAAGDAHVANFGLFATPERRLVFDLNDFDETLEAPFEWDVKRLATSVAVVALQQGETPRRAESAARSSAAAYRLRMLELADMTHLDVWYSQTDAAEIARRLDGKAARRAREIIAKARRRTNLQAFSKLTRVVRGRRVIADDPPLVEHVDGAGLERRLLESFAGYVESLGDAERVLARRYRPLDSARKVSGIGSVGRACGIVLLEGRDASDPDPLILQVKQARRSVLAPHAGSGPFRHQGKRVVAGQRLIQGAGDIFLGWVQIDGRDAYVRQLRDMRGSAEVEGLPPKSLVGYAEMCAAALARGHARSGDAAAIAGYLGKGEAFDDAVGALALALARQNEADHHELVAAIRDGRLEAEGTARR